MSAINALIIEENYVYRTGISIPVNLLEKFDEIINKRGYPSRSEGVRDALRAYITDYTWMSEMKGERRGFILMVYNDNLRELLTIINDIQREFSSIIKTSLHEHVSPEQCLDIVIVHGKGEHIKVLTERFMAIKGIESVKLTTVQIEK